MASNHASLDAAATERKARLAKLKSLKRKQPPTEEPEENDPFISNDTTLTTTQPSPNEQQDPPQKPTDIHLSLRNYDPLTRGPKLGFEDSPAANTETLEDRAALIAASTKVEEEKEREEKPIDLFTLQPKKPNWDLKRDLARKMEVLGQRTDNAIARLVRERVGKKGESNRGGVNGGVDLVEGVKVREREEEEEERREREADVDGEEG